MREINAINTKKHFVVTTGAKLFPTEHKNHELNRSTGVSGNFFTEMFVKFRLNVGKLLFCGCQELY